MIKGNGMLFKYFALVFASLLCGNAAMASNAAAFVSQSVPASMLAGKTYSVTIVMANIGSTTWSYSDLYRLGSRNPYDNDTWGFHRVFLNSQVPPGSNATFTFTVKAPLQNGIHNFQWAMVQEGVEWFGDLAPNVAVTVSGSPGKPTITVISQKPEEILLDSMAKIEATYDDPVSGIDAAKTRLWVDEIELTAQSTITSSGIVYAPPSPWRAGDHAIFLDVENKAGVRTGKRWTFYSDPPPTIYDETPRDAFIATVTPQIRALLADNGNEINLAATRLFIDGIDISSEATMSATQILWTPTTSLAAGPHVMRVETAGSTGKLASKEWKFSILVPPPPADTTDGIRTPASFDSSVRVIP